jgi:hypothetical protein
MTLFRKRRVCLVTAGLCLQGLSSHRRVVWSTPGLSSHRRVCPVSDMLADRWVWLVTAGLVTAR